MYWKQVSYSQKKKPKPKQKQTKKKGKERILEFCPYLGGWGKGGGSDHFLYKSESMTLRHLFFPSCSARKTTNMILDCL